MVLVCCVIVAVGLIYAVGARITADPYGLEKISTTDDLAKLDVEIDYFLGQTESAEASKIRDLEKNKDLYIDMTAAAPVVLLVEPTGTFRQHLGSYCQEVEVLQVVSNASQDELCSGDTVSLFRANGLNVVGDELHFVDSPNILYTGNQYLLFLYPSELNHLYRQKQYNLVDTQFSCVRLYHGEDQKVCISTKLRDCKEANHFSMSQKVLDMIEDIENTLIERHLGSEYTSR
jgi:hypothetical protein